MAVEMKFTSDHPEFESILTVFLNRDGFLGIEVSEPNYDLYILLNKDSAKRLAKELRKQISFMSDVITPTID